MMFTYEEFTTRNIGFVSPEEQQRLRKAKVFICGVGGMGGAAVACLARMGIENFIIVDIDKFEISNLNRQIFANLGNMDQDKALTAKEELKKINPQISVELAPRNWVEYLDEILPKVDLVINGCDDHSATIQLMRKAQFHYKTVIDAFASPLPSVYVVKPNDPRPEKMFGFRTFGHPAEAWTDGMIKDCIRLEIEYVLTHSSGHKHIVLKYAGEMVTGKRKRFSLAPMVWMTGVLMSYEAFKIILNKKGVASYRGVFVNPYEYKIEKPLLWPLAVIKKIFVKRFLDSM